MSGFEYEYSSLFGTTFLTDTITAVEYNGDGEYLATGDRVGRITVLKLEDESKVKV